MDYYWKLVKVRLKIVGTDLEIGIETYVGCEIEREGSIVVNSRIFGDIIRKLPDAPIYINVDNNRINIKCRRILSSIYWEVQLRNTQIYQFYWKSDTVPTT